ncbi:hypothetical protein V8E54_007461 [Elaphomyces granulatus]
MGRDESSEVLIISVIYSPSRDLVHSSFPTLTQLCHQAEHFRVRGARTHETSSKANQKLRTGESADRISHRAILAIKPEFVKLIAQREKNHEYRNYKLTNVTRLLLYETAPKSMITHVIATTHPKVP